jgi:hypothetical protein
MRLCILPIMCILSCTDADSAPAECYPELAAPNYTAYRYKSGIDPRLDVVRVWRKIDAVSDCVRRVRPMMTPAQEREAQCFSKPTYALRSCLSIQLADDWRYSACTGAQVFPCNVPNASCELKGQTPTADCPCSCRAIIQDNTAIVTAPNLELLPGQLTTMLTGCFNPWVYPLNECANPSIGD